MADEFFRPSFTNGAWATGAVAPGRSVAGTSGIAVVSPPVDDAYAGVRAQKAIANVSNALGGNPFESKPH